MADGVGWLLSDEGRLVGRADVLALPVLAEVLGGWPSHRTSETVQTSRMARPTQSTTISDAVPDRDGGAPGPGPGGGGGPQGAFDTYRA